MKLPALLLFALLLALASCVPGTPPAPDATVADAADIDAQPDAPPGDASRAADADASASQ